MTTGSGDLATAATIGANTGVESFARDWQAIRGDRDIQFAPVELPPPSPPPAWLQWLGDVLEAILRPIGQLLGVGGPAVPWLVGGLAVLLAGLLLWRLRGPIARWLGQRPAQPQPAWLPDAGAALALLEDADRLAAQGRYDEATHLLLQRSVGQIAAARPALLEPSATSREIARLPALPETARRAFTVIAERVERSLFALRRLSAEDWHAARAAYAEFAQVAPGELAA